MYEGAPNHPEPDRFWDIIERHRVKFSILRLLPYALSSSGANSGRSSTIFPVFVCWEQLASQSIRKRGCGITRRSDKVLCPIVDTWWQTETGAIMISPLPGATPTKPGSGTKPFPGIEADVMTREGKSVGANEGGYLVIKRPWPSMLRTIWGDDERYREQYWSQIDEYLFCRRRRATRQRWLLLDHGTH